MWSSLFLIHGHRFGHHYPWNGVLSLAMISIIIAMFAYHKIKNRILKWTIVTLASICALGFIIIMIYKY